MPAEEVPTAAILVLEVDITLDEVGETLVPVEVEEDDDEDEEEEELSDPEDECASSNFLFNLFKVSLFYL